LVKLKEKPMDRPNWGKNPSTQARKPRKATETRRKTAETRPNLVPMALNLL
jgi:hypothetical protein